MLPDRAARSGDHLRIGTGLEPTRGRLLLSASWHQAPGTKRWVVQPPKWSLWRRSETAAGFGPPDSSFERLPQGTTTTSLAVRPSHPTLRAAITTTSAVHPPDPHGRVMKTSVRPALAHGRGHLSPEHPIDWLSQQRHASATIRSRPSATCQRSRNSSPSGPGLRWSAATVSNLDTPGGIGIMDLIRLETAAY